MGGRGGGGTRGGGGGGGGGSSDTSANDLTGANGLSSDPAIREVQIENRIRQAYVDLSDKTAGYASLADLRAMPGVAELSYSEWAAGIRGLHRDAQWDANPASIRKILTDRDRVAAVQIGDDSMVLLKFVGPERDGMGTPTLKPLPKK